MFQSRYILLKGSERLLDWEKERLRQLLFSYPDLEKAWILKEDFRECYKQTDRIMAEKMLGLLIKRIADDSFPEFKELLHTLTN